MIVARVRVATWRLVKAPVLVGVRMTVKALVLVGARTPVRALVRVGVRAEGETGGPRPGGLGAMRGPQTRSEAKREIGHGIPGFPMT